MLLVDDGVDADGSLAGRPVADDEFALAAPEREQRIDHENARLHRLGHLIALDDGGSGTFGGQTLGRPYLRAAVERAAERIDDAAEQFRPDRHRHHLAGAAHLRPGADGLALVEQHHGDGIRVEHEREARAAVLEQQQFVEPHVRQARDARDAVGHLFDAADRKGFRGEFRVGDGGTLAPYPLRLLPDRFRNRFFLFRFSHDGATPP